MATQNRIKTANDNAPLELQKNKLAGGFAEYAAHRPLNDTSSQDTQKYIPDMLTLRRPSVETDATGSLKLTLISWVTALIMTIAAFILDAGTGLKVLTSLALLWAGLWGSYVSADHGRWRLSELSVVTALGGLIAAITTAANFLSLGLTLVDGLVLMSITPLLIGYALKSRICVLASICACLIWAGLGFVAPTVTSNLMLLFPLICAAQIFTATRIRSGMAITLAVLTGYYWALSFIYTTWGADNLPLTFAAAALFIIGTAHHRSGKAAEDKKLTGSSIHIYAGWIAAMAGAIGFQYLWLSPDALQASSSTLSPNGLALWKGVVIASLAVTFCSAIVRYKYSQISLAGIFILTAASSLIPLMLWVPALPQNVTAAIPGVSLVPTVGIFMGAGILAAALGMILNGIRRHTPTMMGLGIMVIFVQAYLLLKPEYITIDNLVIFGSGLLASLAIGATIAGSSLAHQAPAPRLKHA